MQRNKAVRRFLALACAISLGALATGCAGGGGDNPGGGDTTSPAGGEAATSSDAGETAASGDADDDAAWAKVVEAAEQEGSVNVYTITANEDVRNELVKQFEAQYPKIKVELTRMESGALTARVAQEIEAQAPTADVMGIVDNIIYTQHPDWFRDLRGQVPNMDKYWPEKWVAADGTYVHQQANEFIISYNTQKIQGEVPTTWDALADWDGLSQGIMADPRASNSFMGWAMFIRDKFGDDVLAKFGKGVGSVFDSSATAAQQVAAGEVPLVFPAVRELTTAMLNAGAPVERLHTEPVIGTTHIWALPKSTGGHPNAGQVFLNFMLSRDAATLTCQKGDNMPVAYDDIPDCPIASEDMTLVTDYFPKLDDTVKNEIAGILGLQ